MSDLLKEYVKTILKEADRGGIEAQHTIVKKLKKISPEFELVSNTKGQQSADVTVYKNGKPIGAIESKSIEGGAGLTALFDNTVSLMGETLFDNLSMALAAEAGVEIFDDPENSVLKQFIEGIGGSAGIARPIPPDLEKNMKKPEYKGYSHLLVSSDGKQKVFKAEPGDMSRKNNLTIFRKAPDGSVKAFMTVMMVGKTLVTSSSARPWASSGTMPASKSIGKSEEVKIAAYELMKEHFIAGGDNYFILVDGNTIYPFVVPGAKDPLKLISLGAPVLSPSSFEKAGLSTYGNAGVGKIRLALKASFSKNFSL